MAHTLKETTDYLNSLDDDEPLWLVKWHLFMMLNACFEMEAYS